MSVPGPAAVETSEVLKQGDAVAVDRADVALKQAAAGAARPSAVAEKLSLYGGVGVGAVLGVLARWYLGVMFKHALPGGVAVNELVANAVGCFVMGAMVELQARLKPAHPAVYLAITTGFCGCCTTFSTFNTKVGVLHVGSAEAYWTGFLQALVSAVCGMATAWCSLQFGRSLTQARAQPALGRLRAAHAELEATVAAAGSSRQKLAKNLDELETEAANLRSSGAEGVELVPSPAARHVRGNALAYWLLLAGAAVAVVTLFAVDAAHVTKLSVSLAAAPFGAWLRYHLGLRNPGLTVPYFTLLANLLAATLSAVLEGLLDGDCFTGVFPVWLVAVFGGLSTGFCGSLSTVSTLTDETRRLGDKNQPRAWGYLMATLLGGQALSTIVLTSFYAGRDCW